MGDGTAAVPRWRLLGLIAMLASLVAVATIDAATRSTAGKGQGRTGALPGDDGAAAERPSAGDTARPDALLPNLGVLPASNVSVDTSGRGRRLRFDSTLVNTGDGPMEVVPQQLPRCPRGQRHVAQVVYTDDDGDARYSRRTDRERSAVAAGCMLFHRGHDHWHIDGSAAYSLTRAGSTTPVVARSKVSFCLRDSDRLRRGAGAPETYGECARDRRQGISVGWSDLYDASLDGQTLPLRAGIGDGDYCLRLRADPRDLFRESDETDNASVVPVRLRGDRVVGGAGPTACA
jgi:hypothetical protein